LAVRIVEGRRFNDRDRTLKTYRSLIGDVALLATLA
jgi:hypothetical protein